MFLVVDIHSIIITHEPTVKLDLGLQFLISEAYLVEDYDPKPCYSDSHRYL